MYPNRTRLLEQTFEELKRMLLSIVGKTIQFPQPGQINVSLNQDQTIQVPVFNIQIKTFQTEKKRVWTLKLAEKINLLFFLFIVRYIIKKQF
ncbi:MAG: hypothetical protein VX737_03035 [Pseudomonadota bacterium]|nr:hypothetical protein [Pseudomonadota bacterium]